MGSFQNYPNVIVQNGATRFDKPIGTGPFKFVSINPGQSSQVKRNPHYWQSGKPYVDEVHDIDIPDPAAPF